MDRIAKWSQGVDTICVLCKSADEDRDHLFFTCSYSSQVWENLARGIMGDSYTNLWSSIIPLLTVRGMERRKRFCLRYAFQVAVYALWRERNRVKHGEKLMPWTVLRKILDKGVRNKLSILQANRVKGMERGLQTWFGARD